MIARFLRSSYRIPGFLFLSLGYTLALGISQVLFGKDRNRIHRIMLRFFRDVYRLMGIRVFVEGELPEEPSILMGNHRSYVDAVMIPAKNPVVFVGRVESKSWPIIGWGRPEQQGKPETNPRVRQKSIGKWIQHCHFSRGHHIPRSRTPGIPTFHVLHQRGRRFSNYAHCH